MLRKFLIILIIQVSFQLFLFSQEIPLNAELIAHVPFSENSSGMWGYVDNSGLKYAVIGTASASRIFSLEDPAHPIERFKANGAVGIWREVRYYKNYIYVSTDQGADGMVIIDMTEAPEKITYSYYKPLIRVGNIVKSLERCHNIFIDEKGYCYLSGCNISNRGVLVFDLNQNPKEPPIVGYTDIKYSHDVYVKGDTMYNSEILNGLLSIYDVNDKSDIKLLTSVTTGRAFTHNAWTTDNSKVVFTTDERADAYVESYDISDFNNIKLLDRFRTLKTEGTGVIPHNTYYKNGFLITSYYTDGIRIIDAHKPDNLVEIAYYDTWNNLETCHSGFSGCWGVYPLDDDDYVYGSDINNGLYIVKINYKRACYLEGNITDKIGNGISNAKVEIISNQLNRKYSNPSGVFKTGQVHNGTFKVRITHPEYFTIETNVDLHNGQTTILDLVLTKKQPFEVGIDVKDKSSKRVVSNVLLSEFSGDYSITTNGNNISKQFILSSVYDVFISQWGYKNSFIGDFKIGENQGNQLVKELEFGYEDNFENHLGWTVQSTSGMTGKWVRALPKQTEYTTGIIANPGFDSKDAGNYAYITGNGNGGAGCDDVDNGITRLISPPMDLTKFKKPALNYDVWFFNEGGTVPADDTLMIKITDGFNEIIVDKISGANQKWIEVRNIDVSVFITPSSSMNLIVEASDLSGSNARIVEAGFDNFFVTDLTPSSLASLSSPKELLIYPNPVTNFLNIKSDESNQMYNSEFIIYDFAGKIVKKAKIDNKLSSIDVTNFMQGFYTISVTGFKPQKFIKY
jgi:choice-of-anchor B domain-containing protein